MIDIRSRIVRRPNIVVNLTAGEFKDKMIVNEKSVLPFYVRTRYRDIVLRYFTGEDSEDNA